MSAKGVQVREAHIVCEDHSGSAPQHPERLRVEFTVAQAVDRRVVTPDCTVEAVESAQPLDTYSHRSFDSPGIVVDVAVDPAMAGEL